MAHARCVCVFLLIGIDVSLALHVQRNGVSGMRGIGGEKRRENARNGVEVKGTTSKKTPHSFGYI